MATWRIPRCDSDQLEALARLDGEPQRLERLRETLGQSGLFYLATCQRILLATPSGLEHPLQLPTLLEALTTVLDGSRTRVKEPELFRDDAAFIHLGEVACSLDSLVPGEPQVLGQFKEAYKRCQERGLLDTHLQRLLSRVLKVAKRVRSHTDLFRGSVSLLPLTTRFLAQAVERAQQGCCQVAVVGTGPIGLALLSKLAPHANLHLYCVSHDLERAREVAAKVPNHTFPMSLEEFLAEPPCLDAIALATAGREAFLTPTEVQLIMSRRCPGHPGDGGLRVLDLAMPRNASREIGTLPGCELVQIDDLVEISEQSKESRKEAIGQAREILTRELANLRRERWKRIHRERILQLRSSLEATAKERLDTFPGDYEADPKMKRWMEQTLNGLIHVAQERLMHALEMVEAIYPAFHTGTVPDDPSRALPDRIPPAMAEALERMGIEVPLGSSGAVMPAGPHGTRVEAAERSSGTAPSPAERPRPEGGD